MVMNFDTGTLLSALKYVSIAKGKDEKFDYIRFCVLENELDDVEDALIVPVRLSEVQNGS